MNKWTMHVLTVNDFPVKVYVNSTETEAVLFFLFGRYMRLKSDANVLDFATNFLLGRDISYPITHSNYLGRQEDTIVTQIENIA